MNIPFTLNGKGVTVNVEPEKRLVDILREDFGLRATKAGCYSGECGACTVLLDGGLASSCLLPAFAVRGSEVTTVEGLAAREEYSDIVRAFAEAEYYPCAYCRGGRILAIEALLRSNPDPTAREILVALSGMSCQCADYTSLVRAVGIAAVVRKSKRRVRRP